MFGTFVSVVNNIYYGWPVASSAFRLVIAALPFFIENLGAIFLFIFLNMC